MACLFDVAESEMKKAGVGGYLGALDGWHDEDVRVDFMVERLEEELRPFVGTTNPIPLSDIAVLYDDETVASHFKDKLLKRTREMLLTMFNIIPMTIEQQLKSGPTTIVLDEGNLIL